MDEIEVKKLFGYNLKRIRKQKNISQMQLAEKVNMAFTFISDIENGKKWVSPESISKFCSVLEVEAYHFFLPENYIFSEDKSIKNFTDELDVIIKNLEKKYLAE